VTLQKNDVPPVLIPAKQFNVWSRLYNRFQLEPFPASGSNAFVSPVIQPITDADRLLRAPDVRIFTVSITSMTTVVMATVPAGERWTMTFIEMLLAGGVWTHNRMQVNDPAGQGMPVNTYASSGASVVKEFSTPVTIEELWTIRVNIDDFTSVGNGQLAVLLEVENAF